MKKILITCSAVLAIVACKPEAKSIDMAKVNSKVDSTFNAKKAQVAKEANEACSANLGKMAQGTADSIMNAKKAAN